MCSSFKENYNVLMVIPHDIFRVIFETENSINIFQAIWNKHEYK